MLPTRGFKYRKQVENKRVGEECCAMSARRSSCCLKTETRRKPSQNPLPKVRGHFTDIKLSGFQEDVIIINVDVFKYKLQVISFYKKTENERKTNPKLQLKTFNIPFLVITRITRKNEHMDI